jgi:TorA maturation chaperone TorD
MTMNTDTTGTTDILLARAVLYSVVSSLFSEPSGRRFERLYDRGFQENVIYSAGLLDRYFDETADSLGQLAVILFSYLEERGEEVRDEHARIFGHSLSRKTAPYETEHLTNKEIFYKTQCLADLNGYYKAFGLEVRSGERADHLAIETEFMMHLIVKEYIAIERIMEEEKIEISRDAQNSFWHDHIIPWVEILGGNVTEESGGELYTSAGRFLQSLMKKEQLYFSGLTSICK